MISPKAVSVFLLSAIGLIADSVDAGAVYNIPQVLGPDIPYQIDAGVMGDWGVGDFKIEMDLRGRGGNVDADNTGFGALFTRNVVSGPTVLICDDGRVLFVITNANSERPSCAVLPNPSDPTQTRHLVLERTGLTLTLTVGDYPSCTHSIGSESDPSQFTGNPLTIGQHTTPCDGFYRALNMDILNVVIHDVPGATSAPFTSGAQGDPIILGLNKQTFKFEGRNEAWHANVANQHLCWNMQFRQFDSCPVDENMFISAMSSSASSDHIESSILIATTPEPIEECRFDPNAICLGEGTLHVSFDNGKSFVSQPGDYHCGSQGRVVAHNTCAACSRKWHDCEVSKNNAHHLREGGRRTTVEEKKPLQLLSDKKAMMIDPIECGTWIDERVGNNELFEQKGHWSTLYVETEVASFHIEHRRSDWVNPACDFQSLDAWMTNVDGKMEKVEWNGILGETKEKIYDASTGEEILSDRSKLLRGTEDGDCEVDGPFGKSFSVIENEEKLNGFVEAAVSTINKMMFFFLI